MALISGASQLGGVESKTGPAASVVGQAAPRTACRLNSGDAAEAGAAERAVIQPRAGHLHVHPAVPRCAAGARHHRHAGEQVRRRHRQTRGQTDGVPRSAGGGAGPLEARQGLHVQPQRPLVLCQGRHRTQLEQIVQRQRRNQQRDHGRAQTRPPDRRADQLETLLPAGLGPKVTN